MRPTLSQAQVWRPESLRQAADAWDGASADIGREFDVVVAGVRGTTDFWTGNAAEEARARAARAAGDAAALARALVAAAAAARNGAQDIAAARDDLLGTVVAVRSTGFTVADDGAVSPPAQPPPPILAQAGGDAALAREVLRDAATDFTRDIRAKLDALGAADAAAAHAISAAFGSATGPAATQAATLDGLVATWPAMSQEGIAAQITPMTPEQRQQLVERYPLQVGNTDGVPWEMRFSANRLNVAQAIIRERGNLSSDPSAQRRIDFYQGLLGEVDDPTGRPGRVQRQILGFDPARSSLIELIGNLDTANNVGVLIPGLNTTLQGSPANTATANRFVKAGHGDLAMITYLGGPFPQGDWLSGVVHAADPRYALDMAPRLVSFSADVNRVVDATGRDIAVTYVGHSYGASVLGRAEAIGLTADRTMYVEPAGSGLGVDDPGDWHNRNPDVVRFSMTAPGDLIALEQGLPFGPHGADPDEMPGVTRLATGRYDDGSLIFGPDAHSGVINEPGEAWRNILAVMTGRPHTVYQDPARFLPPWLRWVS